MQSRYRTAASNSIYQRESIRDQRSALTRSIEELRSSQRVYMPGSAKFIDEIDPIAMVDTPESVKLWLPSSLSNRDTLCAPGLPLMEFRLRYAQAVDSLNQIRRLVRLLRGLALQSQKHPSPTEKTRTRSRSVFEGMQARINQASARYRDAYTALRRLHPSGTWSSFFQELKKEDIRGPGREFYETSESRFIPSWIWRLRAPSNPPDLPGSSPHPPPHSATSPDQAPPLLSPSTPDATLVDDLDVSQEEVENFMMVDWARAHERAKRFEEEVELSVEEMRRTLLFFSWNAGEWKQHAKLEGFGNEGLPDDIIEGLRAYAYRRSAMFQELIKVFVSDWSACLKPKTLGAEWLALYSDVIVVKKGWNRIPSVVPHTTVQPDIQPDDEVLSDLDEALEKAEEGTRMDQDAESELHHDLVQIFADE